MRPAQGTSGLHRSLQGAWTAHQRHGSAFTTRTPMPLPDPSRKRLPGGALRRWKSVMLQETSIDVLQAAMRGLSTRQDAISNNIANVNTPYYTARTASFENELRRAIADGDNPLTSEVTTGVSTSAAGLNGNNVNLADETMLGIETQMKMQLALRATGDRFSLLRSAVRGA